MISTAILDQIITYAGTAVYFGGAALLFRQSLSDGSASRANRVLAFILLMWGVAHVTFGLHLPEVSETMAHPMSVTMLLSGNLYIIICLLYPLELARPGWLGVRRVTLLLLPFVAVTGLYFLILGLLDEPVRHLGSLTSLLTHFREFNVWYRVVLYLSVCFYLVYMFMATGVRGFAPHPLPGDQTPKTDRSTLRQLRIYAIGVICISLAYLITLLYSSPATLLTHRALSALLFGVIALSAARSGNEPAKSAAAP